MYPEPSRVAAHPAGARQVIPEPRHRWLAGGVLAGGWQTDEQLQLEFHMRPLWIAASLHVHPTQHECVRVVSGRLGVTTDDGRRIYRAGEVVEIPAGMRHTLWNAGLSTVRFVDEYRPPLRTAQRFDEMFSRHASDGGTVRLRPVIVGTLAVAVLSAVAGVVLKRRR
jgi:mannose-6-phosphate isomerase-like protein (cupin superfamily)